MRKGFPNFPFLKLLKITVQKLHLTRALKIHIFSVDLIECFDTRRAKEATAERLALAACTHFIDNNTW
jgi:hypothetical protein